MSTGSLVIVQAEASYLVGDVVAFVNDGGINVVHRIVEITEEGFVTQGDNNSFQDREFITDEDIVGRAVLVLPYVGFTILFLKTPAGMSIFGLWAASVLIPRKSHKSKLTRRQSIVILKVALVTTVANYVMTQIVIGMNITIIGLLFNRFLEPSMASTVSFALWVMVLLILYFIARNVESSKVKGIDPVKLITVGGGIMILLIQLMNIINVIPFVIKVIQDLLV